MEKLPIPIAITVWCILGILIWLVSFGVFYGLFLLIEIVVGH